VNARLASVPNLCSRSVNRDLTTEILISRVYGVYYKDVVSKNIICYFKEKLIKFSMILFFPCFINESVEKVPSRRF